jgi:hypothetical protein
MICYGAETSAAVGEWARTGLAVAAAFLMNIRFVSSLTPDDEERLAPGLLSAVGMLLDQLPIAYTLRIETAGGRVFQHAHAGHEASPLEGAAPIVARTPLTR